MILRWIIPTAHALDCVPPDDFDTLEYLTNADYIVEGEVIDVQNSKDTFESYSFEVTISWKGEDDKPLIIYSNGWDKLALNNNYFLVLNEDKEGNVVLPLCLPYSYSSTEGRELVDQLLLEPINGSASSNLPPITLVFLLIGGALIFAVSRKSQC